MPKTKFQSLVFTLIMVFFMVFCMTLYTVSFGSKGLSYDAFKSAIQEMWIEYVIVFVLIFFVITKLAQKLTFRIFSPQKDNPMLIVLSIQCLTVCMIVPSITLIATFIHNGFTSEWLVLWLQTAARCFPAALCLQVFFVGPLVRLIFRTVFRKQLQTEAIQKA